MKIEKFTGGTIAREWRNCYGRQLDQTKGNAHSYKNREWWEQGMTMAINDYDWLTVAAKHMCMCILHLHCSSKIYSLHYCVLYEHKNLH